MIKKYFAMTIIAASVSLAACSDDDDDDEMEAPAPMPVPAPAATPGVGGTAYDTIVNRDDLQSLEDAINAAGLADVLDNPASEFTIFAPSNDALAAAQAALGDDFPADDALARVLQYHVISGTVSSTAAAQLITDAGDQAVNVDTILTDLPDTADAVTQQIALTAGGPLGIVVNESEVTEADVSALGADEAAETPTVGTVHVIGAVLLPPAAPEPTVTEPEPTPEPTPTPGPTDGGADAAIAALGTSEIFRAGITADFAGALDTNAWTFFVPTDEVLGAAGVTALTAAQLQTHIVTNGAFDSAALTTAGTQNASDNTVLTFGTDESGNLTVNGIVATPLATGDAGAQIFSIAGILPGS